MIGKFRFGSASVLIGVAAAVIARGASQLPEWGTTRIEAEDYDEGGEGVGYHWSGTKSDKQAQNDRKPFRADDAVSKVNGGGGSIFVDKWEKDNWLQFTVEASVADTYEILLRYARGNPREGSFSITVNGEAQVQDQALPATQYWWTYADLPVVVKLRQGANVIRIGSASGQMNFDYFELTRSKTFGNQGAAWSVPASGAARIQAENFDVTPTSAAGKARANTYRPNAPVGIAACNDEGGGFAVADFSHLEYSIRAALNGYYKLRFRHNGPAARLHVTFSGVARTGDVELPASENGWKTTEARVLFPKGSHLVRMEPVAGKPALNWMELEKDTATAVVLADPKEKGSYAAEPPDAALAQQEVFEQVYDNPPKWINRPADEPLPTNDWWSNIHNPRAPFAGGLWPYPCRLQVNADAVGMTGYTKLGERPGNIGVEGGQTIGVSPAEGKFTRNALLNFGDWSVCFRVEQTAEQYVDVTIARGMPAAWLEFHDLAPVLQVGTGPNSKYDLFDAKGQPLSGEFTADRIRLERNGVHFAIFAPAGTQFSVQAKVTTVKFAGAVQYLVFAQLPDPSSFDLFAEHCLAVPRDTKFDFAYDPKAGTVTTTWKIDARPLKPGASADVIQGWVPHNYRDIVSGPKLLPNLSYVSANGPIKLSVGNQFTIVQPAPNMSVIWPDPRSIGGKSDYDAERMKTWVAALAAGDAAAPKYGGETYFGMKPIQHYAELALIAKQMDHPGYATFLNAVKVSMTDWFTYTPGEELHYFAWYPRDKALIGFNPSFGSQHFTDNHFHYGYHCASAGVLAMLDEQWGNDYGEMAKLVAKQYANWDRSDKRFPYLRTFECWSGHSYAGGRGDPRGNNQESVSEAQQSWAGLVMLGQALRDEKMTACGMMGQTIETKAAVEYWFDGHRDLFPKTYDRSNVAINYDDSKGAGTFFSAQPEHVLGIIVLPVWPYLDYMGRYPDAMKYACERMLKQRPVFFKGDESKGTWESLDSDKGPNSWLCINLGIYTYVDPQSVADRYEKMWNEKTGTGTSPETAMYYWQTHSYRANGLRDFSRRVSTPIGAAYFEPATRRRTYVAYNPGDAPVTVQVFDVSGQVVDQFEAKPRDFTIVAKNG